MIAVTTGEQRLLAMVAGGPVWVRLVSEAGLGPVLMAICVLNAWMVWQVLRGPALPRAEGLPRSVVWLRRLLYLSVAGDLVVWELLEELSDTVEDLLAQAVWIGVVILLTRVTSGVSAWFRAIALALGLIGALASVPASLGLVSPLTFSLMAWASPGWMVMILVAQRRDGRWSDTTVNIGRVALIAPLLFRLPAIALHDGWQFGGLGLLLDSLGVFSLVWQARTAHDLAGPAGLPATGTVTPPAGGRGARLLVAVAVVLPLTALGAEEGARITFSSADEACRAQIKPYADTLPQDRRWSFLCVARSDTGMGTPLFPEDLADQRVHAYGERLCAVAGADERQALLTRAGGSTDTVKLHEAIKYLCPGVVAQWHAGLMREEAAAARERVVWAAEMNARCTDPWSKLRARRQGTSAYLLSEGGGYHVLDDGDETGDEGGDVFKAFDDGFVHAAGSSAAITTHEQHAPMCLTVKAFSTAPPLRLKGWDRVVEVGVSSRSGRLVLPSFPEEGDNGALLPLPNLAVDGPGRYRMRVYARTFEWDEDDEEAPLEEHLIVVYPGSSTKKVILRPWR